MHKSTEKNLTSPNKKGKPVEVLIKTFKSFTYYKALKYKRKLCTTIT